MCKQGTFLASVLHIVDKRKPWQRFTRESDNESNGKCSLLTGKSVIQFEGYLLILIMKKKRSITMQ